MRESLGRQLLREGLLSEEQLKAALSAQLQFRGRLGTNLIELGYITEDELARALGRLHGVRAATSKEFRSLDRELLKQLSRRAAEMYQAVPLRVVGRTVLVAMTDPLNLNAIDELAVVLRAPVKAVVAPEIRIRFVLEKVYGIRAPERRFVRVTFDGSDDLDLPEIPPSTSSARNTIMEPGGSPPGSATTLLLTPPPLPPNQVVGKRPTLERGAVNVPLLEVSPPVSILNAALQTLGPAPDESRDEKPTLHTRSFAGARAPSMARDARPESGPKRPEDAADPAARAPAQDLAHYGPDVRLGQSHPLRQDACGPSFLTGDETLQSGFSRDRSPPSRTVTASNGARFRSDPSHAEPGPTRMQAGVAPSRADSDDFRDGLHQDPADLEFEIPTSRSCYQPPVTTSENPANKGSPSDSREAPASPWVPVAGSPDTEVPSRARKRELGLTLTELGSIDDRDAAVERVIQYLKTEFEVVLFFITKDEVAYSWKGYARSVPSRVLESVILPLQAPSVFQEVVRREQLYCGPPPAEGRPIEARLWNLLQTRPPEQIIVCPVLIGSRPANILYAKASGDSYGSAARQDDLLQLSSALGRAYRRAIKRKI